MPASPANPHALTARPQAQFFVRIGPADGSPPAENAVDDAWKVLSIERGSGAGGLGTAVLEYDLGSRGERLQYLQTPEGFSRRVEILAVPHPGQIDDSDPKNPQEARTPIFVGDLDTQSITLRPGVETVQVLARVQPWHFGDVLRGPIVHDPETSDPQEAYRELLDDVLFNPLVDGKIERNRSRLTQGSEDPWYVWADPESFRTSKAGSYREETRDYWDLREAIRSLCWRLNGDENQIRNPSIGNAPPVPAPGEEPEEDRSIWADAPLPDNIRLRRGDYLPTYLDALLEPHGYGWYVYCVSAGATINRRIKVYRRTDGTKKTVKLQALHAVHDPRLDNLPALDVSTDIAQLANEIICDGGRKEYEVTVEMYRGWAEAYDSHEPADLKRSDPDSLYHTLPDVWRLWIANEAADYSETRTTVAPIPAGPGFFFDAAEIVSPRRRRFMDCLTLDDERHRREPFAEFWDPQESRWQAVPKEWSYEILDTQMGLRFTGDSPPDELVDLGDDARIRITGTVAMDARISHTAEKQDATPSGRTITLWLDVADRFAFRKVQETGTWASRFKAPPPGEPSYTFDERDDSEALTTYAEAVRDVEESAEITASILLSGIDFGYEIGDLITEVEGRGISFNRNSKSAKTKRYLQVTGLRYDVAAQTTTLLTRPAEVNPDILIARRRNNTHA